MSAEFTIRRAVPADAARLTELYRQLVDRNDINIAPSRLAELAVDQRSALFVCANGVTICGTVLVALCADVMFGAQPFAVVENMIVDDNARGRGAGQLLLREVEQFCRDSGCSKIMLLSSAQRTAAHRWFERLGFNGSAKRGFVKYRRHFDRQT